MARTNKFQPTEKKRQDKRKNQSSKSKEKAKIRMSVKEYAY